MMTNVTLRSLRWVDDRIDNKTVVAIAQALELNWSLREFELGGNRITLHTAEPLRNALQTNTTLKKLSVFDGRCRHILSLAHTPANVPSVFTPIHTHPSFSTDRERGARSTGQSKALKEQIAAALQHERSHT